MKLRLYHENDSRPVGDYDYVQSAVVSPFSVIFKTQTGKDILTNLKFKMLIEDGDRIVGNAVTLREAGDGPANVVGGYYEVIGVPKPKENKTNAASSRNSATAPVPRSAAYAGCDHDEVPRSGSRRKASTQRNRGNYGDSLPFEAGGTD